MNVSALSAMSRVCLLRKKQVIALVQLSDSKLAVFGLVHPFCPRRAQSSSSSTPTVKTTFGTGQFGNPVPVPKDVTMPVLRRGEQPPADENPYAYSSVYRKGLFDWLFGDGWRRPPAKDQGQKMRKEWFCLGFHPTDEYIDWKSAHYFLFWFLTIFISGSCFLLFYKVDWPNLREWASREAYIEMARREKYGLPYVSKDYIDPTKVAAVLPSEEELGDFEIII